MKRSFRVGVCSWSIGADAESLPGKLASTPIRAVQLALSPLVEAGRPAAEAIVSKLADAGIAIASGMMAFEGEDYSTLESIARTGGVRPDASWPAHRAHAEAVAELARDLDIALVTFHAGYLPERRDDPERDRLLERLRTVADSFGERGCRIALETGQETADTLLEVLGDLDHPLVGVNFDPANMILYGKGDPVAALRTLAPHVRQLHVKDAVPTDEPGTWGREVPVGTGAVDWAAFFEVATALEPPVDFIIEREAGDDRLGDIMAAQALIARYLESPSR